ncbi:energy-coupling factor transporter ATP-binding protein EcfA2 [Nitrobacteraceae bacterium AZCC 1564]
MKLIRFRVTNFRSVKDSGWLDVEAVTALIGVNESGKTNLLLPLWKLNPARDGELQPTSDYPKTMFGEIRDAPSKYQFVEAEFECGPISAVIAKAAGLSIEEARTVIVARSYDGTYSISFPNHAPTREKPKHVIADALTALINDVQAAKALKQEEELQAEIIRRLRQAEEGLPAAQKLDAQQLTDLRNSLASLIPENPAKTSVIVPMVQQQVDALNEDIAKITAELPSQKAGVLEAVTPALPKFVYYSNYGNLDSEIYLPHVVQNLERKDLGAKEAAKARTLRVLFQFVKLKPQEILELGRDFKDPNGQSPTAQQLEKIAEAKRTRSILLQSAGAMLTEKFKNWWKQGDYRFRFEADGDHFRIWVADDRRPQEVELENRSTGLQWFLSFYLVFLVESLGEHKQAVLLLDEPGMSLHPLAQRNLSAFFENLAETNQLIYTSHSPFLVDADHLERARKVYIAADGSTKATPDLRHVEGDEGQAGAAYAVHSALNLNVAESLLLGCQPIIVEGASDQHYLTAIKSLLLAEKKIAPTRELVFPPSGGAKTARVVASILSGRDEKLPIVLLDGDGPGKRMAGELTSGPYASDKKKVISIADFVGFDLAEIEDLFPPKFLADEIDRLERSPEERLSDTIRDGEPFVGQVQAWAAKQKVSLPPYWKVELAKRAKQRALTVGAAKFNDAVIERWVNLFNAFLEVGG